MNVRQQLRCPAAKCIPRLSDDLLTDLIMVRTNGWADTGKNLIGIAVICLLHLRDSRRRNICDGTLPASMCNANNPVHWIINQDRHAVSKTHEESDFARIG